MSQNEENKYPLEPPYEDEVVFYEGAIVRVFLSLPSKTLKEPIAKPKSVQSATTPSIFE